MSIPELLNYLNYLIGVVFLVFILANAYILYRTEYYSPKEKKRWILMFITIFILSFFTKGNNLFNGIFEFLDLFGLMFILPILFSAKVVSILYHSSDDFNLNENVEKQRARKKDLFSVYLFILMLFFVPTYNSGGSVTAGNCFYSYQIRCSGLTLPGIFDSPLCIGFIVSGSYGESKNCDITIPELMPIPTILNESLKPGGTSEDKNPDNTVVDISNWQTYKNDKFGFEFRYPNNMKIVFDDIKMIYSGGNAWYRLQIMDGDSNQKPFLSFEIDADGYGPLSIQKRFTLKELDIGGFVVNSIETIEDVTSIDNDMWIDSHYAKNNKNYWWQFEFQSGNIDYDLIFREILKSFKIK